MKTLDDIIRSCTDPATKNELQALKENLEQILIKPNAKLRDVVELCMNGDICCM